MPQEHVLLVALFFMCRLSPEANKGRRAWGCGRCEWVFGLRANRIRLISWLDILRALCLRLRLFPFAGAGIRRLGLGREERSLSFPLTATEKQGNNSLKANHYPRVMLCPTLRARYY